MPQGIPFRTSATEGKKNIAFTTLWDNYPDSLSIALHGKASKAYLLVAASTYHMQSHCLNGTITVRYKDGTENVLELVLPEIYFHWIRTYLLITQHSTVMIHDHTEYV